MTFSPYSAVSPIGRLLVAATFSPHFAVPPIGRLVVVTFSPHQVFRPTGAHQPRIQYQALPIPRGSSARVLMSWPINHARLPGYWALAIQPRPSARGYWALAIRPCPSAPGY
jgi:hypothetical protein